MHRLAGSTAKWGRGDSRSVLKVLVGLHSYLKAGLGLVSGPGHVLLTVLKITQTHLDA